MPNPVVTQMEQTLLSTMQITTPDKLKKLYRRYKDQGYEHFFMLNTMGFKLPATNRVYSHWEENYILEVVEVDADTAGGAAGAAVDVELADAYDADNRFYPRLLDEVLLEGPDGDVLCTIVDIDDAANLTITLRPNEVTKSVPDMSEGQEIAFVSNNYSEGGGQPEGRQSKVEEIYNKLKIIKETKEATGSSLNDATWFQLYKMDTVAPLPNGETWGYYRKAIMDLDHEMACWLSGSLLFGEIVTNNNIVDTSNNDRPVFGTRGLWTESNERGHPYPYVPATLTIGDFDTWNFIYEQEYNFGTEVMLYFGTHLYDETQNMLTDFGRFTDMTITKASRKSVADQYMGGKEDHEMSIGFEYFTKSGRTYMLKKLTTFSNIKQYGADGYTKTSSGMILPIMWDKDPRTGQELPTMGYRYSEQGAYSREYEIWTDGAAGGQQHHKYQGDQDVIKHYVRAEIGAQQFAANRNIVVRPV